MTNVEMMAWLYGNIANVHPEATIIESKSLLGGLRIRIEHKRLRFKLDIFCDPSASNFIKILHNCGIIECYSPKDRGHALTRILEILK